MQKKNLKLFSARGGGDGEKVQIDVKLRTPPSFKI